MQYYPIYNNLGYFPSSCWMRSNHIDRSYYRKPIIQFEFSIAKSLPCDCARKIESKMHHKHTQTIFKGLQRYCVKWWQRKFIGKHIRFHTKVHFVLIQFDLDHSLTWKVLNSRISIEESSLHWLSEISDGDARIALNSLQLALESVIDTDEKIQSDVQYIPLSSIKDGIKVGKWLSFSIKNIYENIITF